VIDQSLFSQPQPLDRVQHRAQRLKPQGVRFDRTARMNCLFIAAVEFIDVAREYPIVFVEAGQGADGRREVAPMAVLGLAQGENLMLGSDGSWAARYVPALLRGYPFGLARTDAQTGNYVVVIDAAADALSATEGQLLFDALGQPTAAIEERRKFLEQLEGEAERTRQLGRRLLELELLQPMRFEATLPDKQSLVVDGFLAVDEAKFAALPADTVVQMHQGGVLAAIYAHRASLGLMSALIERRLARAPRAA
jgi:hypothetical protein